MYVRVRRMYNQIKTTIKKSKAIYRLFGESCICQKHALSALPKKTNDNDKTSLNNILHQV